MIYVNKSLNFKLEKFREFSTRRIPTLDYKIATDYQMNTLFHTYYEKDTKPIWVVPKISVMEPGLKTQVMSKDPVRILRRIDSIWLNNYAEKPLTSMSTS